MLGRIHSRSTCAVKHNSNSNQSKSVQPVKNNGKQSNYTKKAHSRRRQQEIRSIQRGQRHLLFDDEERAQACTTAQCKKKKRDVENVKVKKKRRKNRNGRSSWSSLAWDCDEPFFIFDLLEDFSDIEMSDHSGGGQLPVKKRGHQHHPRFVGQRRSNVPAEEVLAALRRGGVVEMSKVLTADISTTTTDPALLPVEAEELDYVVDISRKQDVSPDDEFYDEMTTSALVDDSAINDCQEDFNRNVISSTETVHDAENNALTRNTATSALPEAPTLNLNETCNTSLPSSCSITPTEDSNLKSPESKPKSGRGTKKSPKSEEKRRKKQQQREEFSKQERSAGDGAPADDNSADTENDPETEEWARLRCTSERTEVVAERETRRHKNRCADYPGLAFGRSVFSSDTMMKFNIIRNELHNIMKTQLKRVNACCGSANS